MNYSKRILETVRLMEPGHKLVDIGCDHGYMCICALEHGLFHIALASDIRPGPLSRAKENIHASGYENQISTVLSDGFRNISPDFDCAVICGMGGLLIRDILSENTPVWKGAKQLILGPHSEAGELRAWILAESGFGIFRESVIEDAGKFYVLLDIRPKGEIDPSILAECRKDDLIRFGNPALQEDITEYRNFLISLRLKAEIAAGKASSANSERSAEKIRELEKDMEVINRLIKQEMR